MTTRSINKAWFPLCDKRDITLTKYFQFHIYWKSLNGTQALSNLE